MFFHTQMGFPHVPSGRLNELKGLNFNDYPQRYHQSPEGTKDYRQEVESRKDGTPADAEHPERNSEGVADTESE